MLQGIIEDGDIILAGKYRSLYLVLTNYVDVIMFCFFVCFVSNQVITSCLRSYFVVVSAFVIFVRRCAIRCWVCRLPLSSSLRLFSSLQFCFPFLLFRRSCVYPLSGWSFMSYYYLFMFNGLFTSYFTGAVLSWLRRLVVERHCEVYIGGRARTWTPNLGLDPNSSPSTYG